MKRLALLFLVGCGTEASDTTPDASVTLDAAEGSGSSGSRIKAITLVTPDGARQLKGWRDTERGEECAFVLATDGTRCLPTELAPLVGAYFADPACTVPAVFVDACDPAPKYIGVSNETACGAIKSTTWGPVYKVAGTVPTLYQKTSGCAVVTLGPDFTIYAAAELVPLTSFQSATITVE